MADENDEALKAAQAVADKVLRRSAIYNNQAQASALEVSGMIPIFIAAYPVTVEKFSFVLSDSVAADEINLATVTLYRNDHILASVQSGGGWPALMVMNNTVTTGDVSEGDVLYLSISKSGMGVLLPQMHFAVTYVQK